MGEAQETETEYDTGWGSQGAGPWVSQLVQDNSLADRNPRALVLGRKKPSPVSHSSPPRASSLTADMVLTTHWLKKNRGQLPHPSSTKTGSRHGHGNRAEAAT